MENTITLGYWTISKAEFASMLAQMGVDYENLNVDGFMYEFASSLYNPSYGGGDPWRMGLGFHVQNAIEALKKKGFVDKDNEEGMAYYDALAQRDKFAKVIASQQTAVETLQCEEPTDAELFAEWQKKSPREAELYEAWMSCKEFAEEMGREDLTGFMGVEDLQPYETKLWKRISSSSDERWLWAYKHNYFDYSEDERGMPVFGEKVADAD